MLGTDLLKFIVDNAPKEILEQLNFVGIMTFDKNGHGDFSITFKNISLEEVQYGIVRTAKKLIELYGKVDTNEPTTSGTETGN